MKFSEFMMLLTGGDGLISSHLVEGFLDYDCELNVTEDFSRDSIENIEHIWIKEVVETIFDHLNWDLEYRLERGVAEATERYTENQDREYVEDNLETPLHKR